MSKKKKNESTHIKPRTYQFNCVNCFNRFSCDRIPPKHSMKYWKEWCELFSPDRGKIERKQFNGQNFRSSATFDMGRKVNTSEQLLRMKDVVDQAINDIEETSKTGD